MVIDLAIVWQHIGVVLLSLMLLIVVKAVILYGAARLFGVQRPLAAEAALLLAQGGEFTFIALSLARNKELIQTDVANAAIAVAGLSMMATPLLAVLARRLSERLGPVEHGHHHDMGDNIAELRDHVVIGGFGRVGQMVARVLDSENVPWVAFDTNSRLVTEHRGEGRMVFFGDASRPELLQRAGAETARAFMVTLDGAEATERMVAEILKIRPNASILARARDPDHAARLIRIGATDVFPETVEASLQLAGRLLENLDFPEDVAAQRIAGIRAVEMESAIRAAKTDS
jgi:CPA2 family monovalent cation:H+ antiporter-2